VSSATNIMPPASGAPRNDPAGRPRPNPVALEVMVSVTGAKASANSAARDLFTEETTTVLVFKDGAVIRLASPVNAGQLLFLTNKKTHQEVVCQVLHVKDFPGSSGYVELKFTEDCVDYWGVSFPEKKAAPEFKVVEQVRAEEITAQAPEPEVAPHREEDVDLLKREVEALREQLESLKKKHVEEISAKAMAEAAAERAERDKSAREAAVREATRTMEALAGDLFKPKQAAPSSAEPEHHDQAAAPEEKPELLMPAAPKEHKQAAPPVVSMSLPVWKTEKSPEEQLLEEEAAAEERARASNPPQEHAVEEKLADEALPKPSLDFSQLPKGAPVNPPQVPRVTISSKTRTIGLVAVLLLAVGGGAWYGHWWKFLPIGKGTPAATPAVAKRQVIPARTAPGKAAAPGSASTSASSSTNSAAAPAGNPGKDSSTSSNSGETESDPAPRTAEEPTHKKGKSKGESAEPAAETPATAPESAASDAPLVEPKLLKAANPVYPPDAMRSYITGDVKAEVIVEASGRVSKVSVISGPKALREAAVEALKQYQYAPATQGGKPIEGKTTEVVKFWFNP
jgi:TonB family protein